MQTVHLVNIVNNVHDESLQHRGHAYTLLVIICITMQGWRNVIVCNFSLSIADC